MKIFVTGHKGYLGSEFVKQYGKTYEIVGYDLVDGDNILDYKNLLKKIADCEMVVHLAGIPKPIADKSFDEYVEINVEGTHNVVRAAVAKKLKRVIFSSSTTIYGIERGIPFKTPIKEDQLFVSQYINANDLSCDDQDLSYHISKVMAEQVLAWYGLTKKIETVALRIGPIDKVFLGTSVSSNNATAAIKLALDYQGELFYEPFSIVDEVSHIDISKAKGMLGYQPEKPRYTKDQIHSTFDDRVR